MDSTIIFQQQKIKEILDKLDQGVYEVFESERYREYLKTLSKFHNYSYRNAMLIQLQMPEATIVAGYRTWEKEFGRYVKQGEQAIFVLAPLFGKRKKKQDKVLDNEEDEIFIYGYRKVPVFDISQTEGDPIPAYDVKELVQTVEGFDSLFAAVHLISPVDVEYVEDIKGGARGYYSHERDLIGIKLNMSESQTIKTLIHEIAHATLHSTGNIKERSEKEVEAESIAFVVCNYFNVDTSDYSFEYIARWSSGRDLKELKASLSIIQKTSSQLIRSIEKVLNKEDR